MSLLELRDRLTLPVIAAPMFLVSGPDLVIGASRAGVLGSFPTANARTAEELERWLQRISDALGDLPYAVNYILRGSDPVRQAADLALIERFRPAVVITSVGHPGAVVPIVHSYGGLVIHDVATERHAERAIAAGVDGLILLTAGAGGHTGSANPFGFVPLVRRMFDGAIILAGAISDGRSIRAARMLGADFAYMGTRFAATQEAMTASPYRELLVEQSLADVIVTDRISGLPAAFLRGSIARAGLDPDRLPDTSGLLRPNLPRDLKAWKDIWSAGHGVGLIDDIPTVADLVGRLKRDYDAAGL